MQELCKYIIAIVKLKIKLYQLLSKDYTTFPLN